MEPDFSCLRVGTRKTNRLRHFVGYNAVACATVLAFMIYRRLHFWECARYTGIVFPIALSIGILVLLSRAFSDLASAALPIEALWHLLALLLIKYTSFILIFSLFCGVLLATARSFQQREMDSWFVAGIGLRHFIAPSLFFALPMTAACFVFSFFASPWAIHANEVLHATLAQKFNPEAVFSGEFRLIPGAQYVYFSGEGPEKSIFIAATGGDSHQVIFARQAINLDIQGEPNLVLSEGRLYQSPRSGGDADNAQVLSFETFKLSLPIVVKQYIRTDGRNIAHLRWNNTEDKAEIIRRINLPLATLFLTLLALFVTYIHPRMKSGKGFFIALLLFTIYINFLYVSDNLMEKGKWPAWLGIGAAPAVTFFVAWVFSAFLQRRR